MSDDKSTRPGWMNDDLHFDVIEGPKRFRDSTDLPISYVAVSGDEPIGFIWYSDSDDAAGFLPLASGGDKSRNASVSWSLELRDCKAEGLSPSAAVGRLAANAGDPHMGWIRQGSLDAESLSMLKDLASSN